MDFDLNREHDLPEAWRNQDIVEVRPRYVLCRIAFLLVGIGLGIYCLDVVAQLTMFLTRDAGILKALRSDWWKWVVGAPITWCTVLGAFLLWGRWRDTSWQRRAGLLLLFNLIDVVTWTISHGNDLGLKIGDFSLYAFLRNEMSQLLGWAEFYLFATLASEVADHLAADPNLLRVGRAMGPLCAIGATLSVLEFFGMLDRRGGWPPRPGVGNPEVVLLMLIGLVLTFMATAQTVLLSLLASRKCRDHLAHLARVQSGDDLLEPRSKLDDP
ncbi:MAG: hypothetical protein NVSMB14_06300 [Isosphaeraceae bacterium]